jgi:hypothetical protein
LTLIIQEIMDSPATPKSKKKDVAVDVTKVANAYGEPETLPAWYLKPLEALVKDANLGDIHDNAERDKLEIAFELLEPLQAPAPATLPTMLSDPNHAAGAKLERGSNETQRVMPGLPDASGASRPVEASGEADGPAPRRGEAGPAKPRCAPEADQRGESLFSLSLFFLYKVLPHPPTP